ncbi:SDR family NAD(P)-dependent oxidoreductase [Dankookia sp. P2]|uniref:SDR family NAD(P)-dependent oxidoreductase n=1 Tax=Dankookia sp. P2 TaxID=3423955 RepID=UPI003D680026
MRAGTAGCAAPKGEQIHADRIERPRRAHHRRLQGPRPRHCQGLRRGRGKVAIVARNAEQLAAAEAGIKAASPDAEVVAIPADISTAAGCEAAFAAAEKAFGQVDILINNAGTSQRGPFLEVSDALWQNDLDLKLFAAIRLGRLVWPGMQARKWGRIINVLNTGAKAPPAEGRRPRSPAPPAWR